MRATLTNQRRESQTHPTGKSTSHPRRGAARRAGLPPPPPPPPPPLRENYSAFPLRSLRRLGAHIALLYTRSLVLLNIIHLLDFHSTQEREKRWRIRYVRRRPAGTSTTRHWRCRRITRGGAARSGSWTRSTPSRGASPDRRTGRALPQVGLWL